LDVAQVLLFIVITTYSYYMFMYGYPD